ncbi:Hypothetical protein MVR_LOCUS283 [uncultured virus]|nr:Hypothetical protein MVR_LOCUS283 [uncultured virus]
MEDQTLAFPTTLAIPMPVVVRVQTIPSPNSTHVLFEIDRCEVAAMNQTEHDQFIGSILTNRKHLIQVLQQSQRHPANLQVTQKELAQLGATVLEAIRMRVRVVIAHWIDQVGCVVDERIKQVKWVT